LPSGDPVGADPVLHRVRHALTMTGRDTLVPQQLASHLALGCER
jgi:hypothetical protein